MSRKGIVVTVPEYPFLMSLLAFMKSYILRYIERNMGKNFEIRQLLHDTYCQSITEHFQMADLQRQIAALDWESGGKYVVRFLEDCAPG